MTIGCTHCRDRVDVDDMCWFDGMVVCPDCFDELVEEKQKQEKDPQ